MYAYVKSAFYGISFLTEIKILQLCKNVFYQQKQRQIAVLTSCLGELIESTFHTAVDVTFPFAAPGEI